LDDNSRLKSFTFPVWQILNVCDEAFDVGLWMCLFLEPFVDLVEKFGHNFPEGVVIQQEILACITDLQ
jgi:hypothetical protein